jgi:nitrogen fixation protein NifB
MRLAFASNDEVFVDQHFGRSRKFVIAEIDEITHEYSLVEVRENDAPCSLGEHDEKKFEDSAALISDCKVLFAARAGQRAKQRLQLNGVQVLEKPGYIEEMIVDYIRYLERPMFGGQRRRDVINDHPCFSARAHNARGRVHLPVSPVCNIQCRFCVRARNTDENRPGVAAGVLHPEEAVDTVRRALELCPDISVVGVAGPGDALASEDALKAFRNVHAAYPGLIKCLATNGLELPGRARDLWDAGVRAVTVTVNAVDGEILGKIVSWVRGGGDLIAAQLAGIRECSEAGMVVKVNTVLIPGVNDGHIAEVARAVKGAGAARHNIIPLIPGSEFADILPPTCEQIETARRRAGEFIEQFRHCKHCRADACGIPGVSDLSQELYQGRELETFSHG